MSTRLWRNHTHRSNVLAHTADLRKDYEQSLKASLFNDMEQDMEYLHPRCAEAFRTLGAKRSVLRRISYPRVFAPKILDIGQDDLYSVLQRFHAFRQKYSDLRLRAPLRGSVNLEALSTFGAAPDNTGAEVIDIAWKALGECTPEEAKLICSEVKLLLDSFAVTSRKIYYYYVTFPYRFAL